MASTVICTSAAAQWLWLDGSGRKVFSDTPPPSSIPEKDILRRAELESTNPVVSVPANAPTPAATPQISGRDAKLEDKKKQAEAQEQAQKKAEADKLAKARQENCERAKRSKATLGSGVRVITTNAKGEREFMNDAARAAQAKRMEEIIRTSCANNAP